MGKFSIRKLFQELLVIGCLVVAGWVGYQLFILHSLDPVIGGVIFVVDIGVLIWNIVALRSHYYKGLHPSFKLVFLSLLGIVLVLAFAGIEPLSGYKDSIVEQVTNTIKSDDTTEEVTRVDSAQSSFGCSFLGKADVNYPLDIVVSNTGVMWIDADTPIVFFELDVGTNDGTVLGCVYLVSVNDGTGDVQRKIVLESLDERKHKSGFYISGQVALDIIGELTSNATKQYEVALKQYDNVKNKLYQLDEKEREAFWDWQTGRSRAPSLSTISNWEDEHKKLEADKKEAKKELDIAFTNLQMARANIQVPSNIIMPYIEVEVGDKG